MACLFHAGCLQSPPIRAPINGISRFTNVFLKKTEKHFPGTKQGGAFMERIWAPWRMTYITNAPPEDVCIFCRAWEANDDRELLLLVRREQSMIMLNRYPYTCGHLMVAPVRHTAGMDDLSDAELLDLMHGVRQACALLRDAAQPHGFNIGINLGRAAGAGV